MYVSTEPVQDELVIKIRDPNVFKSVEYDARIAYSSSIMASTVKK